MPRAPSREGDTLRTLPEPGRGSRCWRCCATALCAGNRSPTPARLVRPRLCKGSDPHQRGPLLLETLLWTMTRGQPSWLRCRHCALQRKGSCPPLAHLQNMALPISLHPATHTRSLWLFWVTNSPFPGPPRVCWVRPNRSTRSGWRSSTDTSCPGSAGPGQVCAAERGRTGIPAVQTTSSRRCNRGSGVGSDLCGTLTRSFPGS